MAVVDAGLEFTSDVADGGVAHILDTAVAFSSGKLWSLRNNGVEKAYFDDAGGLDLGGTLDVTGAVTLDGSTMTATSMAASIARVVLNNGTTGTPSLQWTGDPSLGFYLNAADDLRIANGGADQFTFTNGDFSVVSGSISTTGAATLDTGANGSSFGGDLTVNGDLGIGITPVADFHMQRSGGAAILRYDQYRDSAFGISWEGRRARGSSGTPAVLQDGDNLLTIAAKGHDGTDFAASAAEIQIEVDGTPGTDDMPGRIVFSTTQDGAFAATEALRLDSAQKASFAGDLTSVGAATLDTGGNGSSFGGALTINAKLTATFPNTSTGTGLLVATNDGSTQEVFRDSSTLAHKSDIGTVSLEDARRFLAVDAISYEHRGGHRDVGFGAEHVHGAGLEDVVTYVDGEPMGFKSFGRGLIGYHHVLIQDHETRTQKLERALSEIVEANPDLPGVQKAAALLN